LSAPPGELRDQLVALGIASEQELAKHWRRARRLAGELTDSPSPWIDALRQSGTLTPLQARWLQVGRGDDLAVGPHVLLRELEPLPFARCYRALQRDTRQSVCLAVLDRDETVDPTAVARWRLLQQSQAAVESEIVVPIDGWDRSGDKLWARCADHYDQSTAEIVSQTGRLPAAAVEHILQQVALGLYDLERAGVAHGHLSAFTVRLSPLGKVRVTWPQLRCLVDWAPQSLTADLNAFGRLGWHLLAGRSPDPPAGDAGGDVVGLKRRIPPIETLAPDTPRYLVQLLAGCLTVGESGQFHSFREVVERLSAVEPTTRVAAAAVARRFSRQRARRLTQTLEVLQSPVGLTVAAGMLAAMTMLTWPTWRGYVSEPIKASTSAIVDDVDRRLQPAVEGVVLRPPTTPDTGVISASAGEPITAVPHDPDVSTQTMVAAAPLVRRLKLDPQRTLRPAEGKRLTMEVGDAPIWIEGEGRLEDIDFIWERPLDDRQIPRPGLKVAGANVEFVRCTFRGEPLRGAIEVVGGDSERDAGVRVATNLRFEQCLFDHVAIGILHDRPRDLVVRAENTLWLGPGSFLVREELAASSVEVVELSHCTLRGATCLAESLFAEEGAQLSAEVQSSVLALASRSALIVEHAAGEIPDLQIAGSGSTLAVQALTRALVNDRGKLVESPQEAVVSGLVRGEVEFAGGVREGIAASQAVRWRVPQRGTAPPGIGEFDF
jgi:hypothetical protein